MRSSKIVWKTDKSYCASLLKLVCGADESLAMVVSENTVEVTATDGDVSVVSSEELARRMGLRVLDVRFADKTVMEQQCEKLPAYLLLQHLWPLRKMQHCWRLRTTSSSA